MNCPVFISVLDSPLSTGAMGGSVGPFLLENAPVKPMKSVSIPGTKSQIDAVEKNLATIFGDIAPSGDGILLCTTHPSLPVSLLRELPLPPGHEVQHCKDKWDSRTR